MQYKTINLPCGLEYVKRRPIRCLQFKVVKFIYFQLFIL